MIYYTTNNIKYFDEELIQEAIEYMRPLWPEEACGVFSEGRFIPFENRAEDPKKNYIIDSIKFSSLLVDDKIDCIIHSHDNCPRLSYSDMQTQEEIGVPHGVINFKKRSVTHVIFWGEELPMAPLLGRPFFWGVSDCLTLVRDYYKINYNIELPNPLREWGFWKKGITMFEDGLEEADYLVRVEPKQAKEGDLLFFGNETINHCGILLKRGLTLQQFVGRLSAEYPIKHNIDKLKKVYRVK